MSVLPEMIEAKSYSIYFENPAPAPDWPAPPSVTVPQDLRGGGEV
jgi:hypothetical protein